MTGSIDSRQPIEFDGEEFHPVTDIERLWVSRSGRVVGADRARNLSLKNYTTNRVGSLAINVRRGEKNINRVVAMLVWRTFVGKPSSRFYPAPIDGNPSNVSLNNLELRPRKLPWRAIRVDRWNASETIQFDGEEFRIVPGEDVAYASASGRVAYYDSCERVLRLAWVKKDNGRFWCQFSVDGDTRVRSVHAMVWRAFRGEVPPRYYVDSDSGDVRDASLDNLALRHRPRGLDAHLSLLSRRQVLEIRSQPELSLREISDRYGISVSCAGYIKRGETYRDVDSPDVPQATPEQRERSCGMLIDAGIDSRVARLMVSEMDSRGLIKSRLGEWSRSTGMHGQTIGTAIKNAAEFRIIERLSRTWLRVSIEMRPDHWQEIRESRELTDYQRGVLAVRVRESIRRAGEIPVEAADGLVRHVQLDGTVRPCHIDRAAYSDSRSPRLRRQLLDDGVLVPGRNRQWLLFVDLPPRQRPEDKRPRLHDSTTEATVDQYTLALELLSLGEELPHAAREAGIAVAELDSIAKVLRMTGILSSLVSSGKSPDDVASIFGLPVPAATALLAHADHSDSSISATARQGG